MYIRRDKLKMKKIYRVVPLIVLSVLVLAFYITSTKTQAASKLHLLRDKLTISIGHVGWDEVVVENAIQGAYYTYISSNKNIVKVDSKTGDILGMNQGKATVTVMQTYQNKTKKVAACKVTVKDTQKISEDYIYDELCEFGVAMTHKSQRLEDMLQYFNYLATYTLETSDPSVISISGTPTAKNNFSVTFKGKKIGTSMIHVTQHFNGKSRSLGSVKFTVFEANAYNSERVIEKGIKRQFVTINYPNMNYKYKVVSSDEKIAVVDSIEFDDNKFYYFIKAKGAGEATLTYYENDKVLDESIITGTYHPITKVVDLEGKKSATLDLFSNTREYWLNFNLIPKDANAMHCSVESSDKSVFSILKRTGTDWLQVKVAVHKKGSAKLIVKNLEGDVIYRFPVKVIDTAK